MRAASAVPPPMATAVKVAFLMISSYFAFKSPLAVTPPCVACLNAPWRLTEVSTADVSILTSRRRP